MKRPGFPFVIVASSLLLCYSARCIAADEKPPATAAELVDRAQMCGKPWVDKDVPIPLFQPLLYRELSVSWDDAKQLRAKRKEVVDVLLDRLKKMHARVPASVAPLTLPSDQRPPDEGDSGFPLDQWNGIYGQIITEVNAVEAMPELLRLEEEYHILIPKFEANPKAEMPSMYVDYFHVTDDNFKPISKHDKQLLQLKIVQRELLSVMLQLMRHQRYQPLLASDIEKTYAAIMKGFAIKLNYDDVTTAEQAKARQVMFDPIEHLALTSPGMAIPTIPYSEEARNEVRGLAEPFAKLPPPLTGDDLLGAVISAPGNYTQLCGAQDVDIDAIPIPLFRPLGPHEIVVSRENLRRLRADREYVVPALKKRLAVFDIGKSVPDDQRSQHGVGPPQDYVNGTYFEIVRKLDAVETLPELIGLESKLHKLVLELAANPKMEPPKMVRDENYMFYRKSGDDGLSDAQNSHDITDRERQVGDICVYERDVLSLMFQLLRRQRFQPLIDSRFEKIYGPIIIAEAKKNQWENVTGVTLAKSHLIHMEIDPVDNVAMDYYDDTPTIPYSEKTRQEVLDLVSLFMKTVPPEKWTTYNDYAD